MFFELNQGNPAATNLIKNLNSKKEYEIDTLEVRNLKSIIRRKESIAATRYLGLPDENVHFLNLPFYETGTPTKNKLGEEDLKIMQAFISKIKTASDICF